MQFPSMYISTVLFVPALSVRQAQQDTQSSLICVTTHVDKVRTLFGVKSIECEIELLRQLLEKNTLKHDRGATTATTILRHQRALLVQLGCAFAPNGFEIRIQPIHFTFTVWCQTVGMADVGSVLRLCILWLDILYVWG